MTKYNKYRNCMKNDLELVIYNYIIMSGSFSNIYYDKLRNVKIGSNFRR